MTSTRTHTCVFFDDGELEHHVCACGRRALYVLDDGSDGVLVAQLDDEVAAMASGPTGPLADLAASA